MNRYTRWPEKYGIPTCKNCKVVMKSSRLEYNKYFCPKCNEMVIKCNVNV